MTSIRSRIRFIYRLSRLSLTRDYQSNELQRILAIAYLLLVSGLLVLLLILYI